MARSAQSIAVAIKMACRKLGLYVDPATGRLDETLRDIVTRKEWIDLSPQQTMVEAALWDDFPAEPWDTVFRVNVGHRLGGSVPRSVGLDETRSRTDKYGLVLDDGSFLIWDQVIWQHTTRTYLVQESIHYQRRHAGPGSEDDWVFRYDFRPLERLGETRRFDANPVHHLHVGNWKSAEYDYHLPTGRLTCFSILRWLLGAFQEAMEPQRRATFEENIDGFRRALNPVADLISGDRGLCA